jgi:alkylation response protein AidB-like acyl-CoA dehydrogenase
MRTRAEKRGDGYVLNGVKHYISLAPVADVALVFALTDPEAGKWGVSAFLVELASDGVTRSANHEKMGLRTVPFGDIAFEDCMVPEANRIGPEGAGVSLSTSFLEWERCAILASQIGAMQRQLERTIDYAKQRKQFGQPIGKYQSVANRIVDMRLRLETARLLLYRTAWLKQSGKPAMTEAALLKLHLAETFVESSLDAIRVHGGHGYVSDNGVERDLRDAVGGTIYAGTSDIQRNIVARLLGL